MIRGTKSRPPSCTHLTRIPDKRLRDSLTFLKEFAKHPTKVGAIAPSSAGLVEAMVEWFDWKTVTNVVEFGPGTGVFTEAVLARKSPEANFFAIERSSEMAETTRKRCPEAKVFEDSATNLGAICDQEGMHQIDAVICGLPWASFPESLQHEIIDCLLDRLCDGGQFATFAYWQGVVLPAGQRFSKLLHQRFGSVSRSRTVWRNLPPAFVYRCVK